MLPEYAGELDQDRLVVGLKGLTDEPIVEDFLLEGEDLEDVADVVRPAVNNAVEGYRLPDGPPVLDDEFIDVRQDNFGEPRQIQPLGHGFHGEGGVGRCDLVFPRAARRRP